MTIQRNTWAKQWFKLTIQRFHDPLKLFQLLGDISLANQDILPNCKAAMIFLPNTKHFYDWNLVAVLRFNFERKCKLNNLTHSSWSSTFGEKTSVIFCETILLLYLLWNKHSRTQNNITVGLHQPTHSPLAVVSCPSNRKVSTSSRISASVNPLPSSSCEQSIHNFF